MPRRMVTSEIWFNEKFTSLPDPGRLLFIGIFSNADDDGRLKAAPKYLKAHIFPYDDDKTVEEIQQLRDKLDEVGLIRVYSRNGRDYLDLPGWVEHQIIRKDRYKPSSLPPCDSETRPLYEPDTPEETKPQPIDNQEGDERGRKSSQVKSSQVKSIKYNISQVNFADVIENEKDLTDRLTMTLTELSAAGRQRQMDAVKKLWSQAGKTMDAGVFEVVYESLGKYPVLVLARSLAKAVNYSSGKKKPANYIKAILEEKMENNK